MKLLQTLILHSAALLCVAVPVSAADPEISTVSASNLAAQLSAKQQDGTSHIRLRMEIKQPSGAGKATLQLQIKSRASRAGTDLVYQVLWPKERKGEAVLLRRAGNRPASGAHFIPPDKLRSLDASEMRESLFGSDLSYGDVIENFFAWDQQEIVGTEVVDRVNCHILESKPGKGERSPYSSVRSWVDTRRLVPLRVEKYSGGKLVRRIDTTRVVTDDAGRAIPANLTVHGPGGGSVTDLDGSRIKHGVSYSDEEFTPEGLKQGGAPRGTAE